MKKGDYKNMQKEKIYHYTVKDRLLKILASGEIQRSPRNRKDLKEEKGKLYG